MLVLKIQKDPNFAHFPGQVLKMYPLWGEKDKFAYTNTLFSPIQGHFLKNTPILGLFAWFSNLICPTLIQRTWKFKVQNCWQVLKYSLFILFSRHYPLKPHLFLDFTDIKCPRIELKKYPFYLNLERACVHTVNNVWLTCLPMIPAVSVGVNTIIGRVIPIPGSCSFLGTNQYLCQGGNEGI